MCGQDLDVYPEGKNGVQKGKNAQRGIQVSKGWQVIPTARGRREIESTEGRISREVREDTMGIQMANLEALPYCDIKTRERPAQPRL